MGHLDDTQRTIIGGLGALIAASGPPTHALIGLAIFVFALWKPR